MLMSHVFMSTGLVCVLGASSPLARRLIHPIPSHRIMIHNRWLNALVAYRNNMHHEFRWTPDNIRRGFIVVIAAPTALYLAMDTHTVSVMHMWCHVDVYGSTCGYGWIWMVRCGCVCDMCMHMCDDVLGIMMSMCTCGERGTRI